MRLLTILSITATCLISHLANADDESNDPLISKFPSLLTWFTSHGGYVDPRITIGYDENHIRGMMTTKEIPAETLLIHTPKTLVLSDDVAPADDQCADIEAVIHELKVGTQSKWHTYFEFDDSTGSRVPSQWDPEGRAVKELEGLPPYGETHRHINWYKGSCRGGKELNEIEWKAFMMFLTRAADLGLVPIYDLMNHHNGKINTKLERDSEGGLRVIALTDISANSPIYNTYARSGWESTVDTFNTYGFVEDYPQLWVWTDDKLVQMTQDNKEHAFQRYRNDVHDEGAYDRSHYVPNSHHYEILVLSPTVGALYPTQGLVEILGNGQRSMEEWQILIKAHHDSIRASHDEAIIPTEKAKLEKVARKGRVDVGKQDAIQAIEFRLAFKQALKLAQSIAENVTFLEDSDEL
ncbi:predicted protein [Thalassiosira pseudonana CCMP1335]|uniref:SET domain-containing protein n=1 Tax=Thalassiosira pseudonana TaxID=35128 RepID=B8CA54_THAPS|nr:predicted protein [Thalassiosira pseudonana CCMP1335]EED89622.1 predicted protein [Thalassiosira pseudonana CCMP1335]